jgi:hypothetical protein
MKRIPTEDPKWFVGTVVLSIIGLYLASSQAESAASQAKSAEGMQLLATEQAADRKERERAAAADRKERERAAAETKDEHARHAAVRVHYNATDAFVFAKRAHHDGVVSDHISARAYATEALDYIKRAYDTAVREASTRDEPRPAISTHLHKHLQMEALVMWHAVMLYYAASTALHTLDEDHSVLMDTDASPTARRRFARDTIRFARTCLAQAEARARHSDPSVLGMWEEGLLERIALRQADADSFFAAICDNPDQAAAAYEKHSADAAKAGIEHLRARFDSNHAMALFGIRDDGGAVGKLRSARDKLLKAAETTSSDMESALVQRWLQDDAKESASVTSGRKIGPTHSATTFQTAFREFCECRTHDRQRILRRKKLSVPCTLLLVSSFVEAEDLVPMVDEVLDAAEAFVRNDPKLAFDDSAWFARRGLVRLLTALFMALEASQTDDRAAAEAQAHDLIHSASRLATVRGSPESPSTAGDVGAFAQLVAKGRPLPTSWWPVPPPSVEFSLLSRARRLKVEADRIRKQPPSRQTHGGVIDAARRARIDALLKIAHNMCPQAMPTRR